jgi:hypothetical protein
MIASPLPNGSSGRGAGGRFGPGNPGGPGNPHAAQIGRWRAKLAASVTEDDLAELVRALATAAKAGQPPETTAPAPSTRSDR